MRALGRDLISVPLARRLRHRIYLADVDDRAGAIGWIRPLVEDIDLVADFGIDGLVGIAADEDAAIGFLVRPELSPDLKVLVGIFANKIGEILAVELVGNEGTVLHRPIGFADLIPLAHFGAVEQRGPALALA